MPKDKQLFIASKLWAECKECPTHGEKWDGTFVDCVEDEEGLSNSFTYRSKLYFKKEY